MSERAEFFIQGDDLLAEPYHYLASGLDNVFLLNGVAEKNTDYGPMVHIENIIGLHCAIGLHIVEKQEPMTGAEFRFLRKQLQISQAALAAAMGVTELTVSNYENGKTRKGDIGPADAFMRAVYLVHIVPEKTRVKVIKPVIDAASQNLRRKLSEPARREIVERWREGGTHKQAA
jgi:putative transcriptional regulator